VKIVCKFCDNKLINNSFGEMLCNHCSCNVLYIFYDGKVETIVMNNKTSQFTIILDLYRKETRIFNNRTDDLEDYVKPQVVLDYVANITPDNLEKKLRLILTFM